MDLMGPLSIEFFCCGWKEWASGLRGKEKSDLKAAAKKKEQQDGPPGVRCQRSATSWPSRLLGQWGRVFQ